jgi:hypothetical protein
MGAAPLEMQETLLLRYPIASGDMKFIEVNQRDIYLRNDPASGIVLRGEIPDCGPGCYADLGQVILEYVMTWARHWRRKSRTACPASQRQPG